MKINQTLGYTCFTEDSLGSREVLWLQGAIIQKDSASLNPFDGKLLPCCCISTFTDCLQSVSVHTAECVRMPRAVYFSPLPDVRHQGRRLAVDADAAIDSLVTAASWSPSPSQCSSWQRLQVLPSLTRTKVTLLPDCASLLVMLFRRMLCRDLVRDVSCLFFCVTVTVAVLTFYTVLLYLSMQVCYVLHASQISLKCRMVCPISLSCLRCLQDNLFLP